ncbi:ParA family protein [Frankia sp. AiPa1]|uniref:ParA family protein n=1 Tax=Frankia sp. AiPa1 TaxID=573492 RepID=UPI00202B0B51|nr:ParA family protein [Frankia sp. AiPa1]MCL9761634.1 ParA family protein [Frankia sp. AiPa1]
MVNYKGGVGKTTLTANIGAEMARRGNRVLLVDLDPQASLTLSFYHPEQWREYLQPYRTIKHWFEGWSPEGHARDPRELVDTPAKAKFYVGGRGQLDVIASDLTLSDVEEDLVVAAARHGAARERHDHLRVFGRLRDAFRGLPPDAYELVLIDCPPSFGMLTRSALVASDFVLIPARPDELSTVAIEHFMDRFHRFRIAYDDAASKIGSLDPEDRVSARILGIVFTMVRFHGSVPILVEQNFINLPRAGIPVFETVVRESHSLYADAAGQNIPMVLSEQAPDKNVAEMRTLVTQFVHRIGEVDHA